MQKWIVWNKRVLWIKWIWLWITNKCWFTMNLNTQTNICTLYLKLFLRIFLHVTIWYHIFKSYTNDLLTVTNKRYINHHHHVVPLARISQTFSHHFSLSFIASGRSSGLHPVSSHNCCMYVRAGPPAFARPYVGVHRSTSLMSSSLLLQQCPALLVRLTWIVFVMGGRLP